MKFIIKVKISTLIEEVKKLEIKNLESKRNLALDKEKVRENANSIPKKNKKAPDMQEHLVIPQIQVFG